MYGVRSLVCKTGLHVSVSGTDDQNHQGYSCGGTFVMPEVCPAMLRRGREGRSDVQTETSVNRDGGGREIHTVVELPDGRWSALDVENAIANSSKIA